MTSTWGWCVGGASLVLYVSLQLATHYMATNNHSLVMFFFEWLCGGTLSTFCVLYTHPGTTHFFSWGNIYTNDCFPSFFCLSVHMFKCCLECCFHGQQYTSRLGILLDMYAIFHTTCIASNTRPPAGHTWAFSLMRYLMGIGIVLLSTTRAAGVHHELQLCIDTTHGHLQSCIPMLVFMSMQSTTRQVLNNSCHAQC